MRYISKFEEELEVFSALGSEVRVSILNLLIKNGRMSMNDLAQALDLSNGALTPHIRKLEGIPLPPAGRPVFFLQRIPYLRPFLRRFPDRGRRRPQVFHPLETL